MNDDVVITGIGVVLPGALTPQRFWGNLRDGHSQFGPIRRGIGERTPVRVAAHLPRIDFGQLLPELPDAHLKKYSREMLATMAALEAARTDASLAGAVDPGRVGFIDSSSRGPAEFWYGLTLAHSGGDDGELYQGDPLMAGLPGSPASFAAMYSDVRGTVATLSNACVGGNHALGVAVRELQAGAADAMFVGGHEFPLVPSVVQLYSGPGRTVLSCTDDPATAMRPYAADRTGFVLGEGALVLCLERAESARARAARAYASVLGAKHINEAAHPTRMDLSGRATADMIVALLADSAVSPERVGYVCGHGTATRYNDLAESRALGLVWDDRGFARPPLGSVKPIYGHLFGGASVLNIAATALMLHEQTLCPTLNSTPVDPDCDHDHVASGARATDLDVAVSLSFALGSQSSAVALGRAA